MGDYKSPASWKPPIICPHRRPYYEFRRPWTHNKLELRAIVRACVPQATAIDEVMQEVSVVARRKFATFTESAQFSRWTPSSPAVIPEQHSFALSASDRGSIASSPRAMDEAGCQVHLHARIQRLNRHRLYPRRHARRHDSHAHHRVAPASRGLKTTTMRARSQVRDCLGRKPQSSTPALS